MDLRKECSTIMHMFRKKKSHELNKYIPNHLIEGHIDLVNKSIEKEEQELTGPPYTEWRCKRRMCRASSECRK